VARCGDGVIDSGEACDEGAANDDREPNACRASCEEARCGDGVVDDGELCDPQTGMPCNADCSSEDPAAPPLGDGGMRDDDEADVQSMTEDDGGCGCRIAGASPASNRAGALLFALGMVALIARRARRVPRASSRALG
jgi:MYXO-CTERM domain-containing protein